MDFSIYENEIEDVFLDNPVIVLDELLKNQKGFETLDIIKLIVMIQEKWIEYQRFGIKLTMTIDEGVTGNSGISIKEYNLTEDINKILTSPELKTAEYRINKNGFIQGKEFTATEWNIEKLSQKSHFKKKVIFFLGINGIDVVINGVIFKSTNHLSSYKDMIWSKMLSIASYSDLLNRFFEENVQYDVQKRYFLYKESIPPAWQQQLTKHPKLLINKPEEKFQLDLVKFLKDNCQDTVLKEVQNDEQERYDIWVGTDQKEVYIFEIKWLGKSITQNGNINSKYNSEERAIEGSYQLLDYIKNEERTLEGTAQSRIHLGILVLFDAREKMEPIEFPDDVKNIPNLDLTQHFMIEKEKVKANLVYKSKK